MVTPNSPDTIPIINYLKNLDCCSRCILRFLKVKASSDIYLDPETYLNDILGETSTELELPLKKVKPNPCRTCLDILQDSTIRRFAEGIKSSNINEYNYSQFITQISTPKCTMIREHSMCIYLKEKFPEFYNNLDGVESMKKIFKIVSSNVVCEVTSKFFNMGTNFVLSFEVEYEDDELEVQNINKLSYLFKKGNQHEPSRNIIIEMLSKCKDASFKEHFPVPPVIPMKETTAKVHCMAEPIYIGGRYLKFSRDMGQTPWVVNNKVLAQYNLQDIIFDSITKVTGFSKVKLKFSASGREDSDVRMLGNGRPFYIQIDDPKEGSLSFDQCRAIEREVFRSKLAAVVKLQNIAKHSLERVKIGEERKRKHYYALCQVDTLNINHVLNVINAYKDKALEIAQKTPLRVLHRRSLAARIKHIHSMEGRLVEGYADLIQVELVTQAGTYVKEFINGDFQRTEPSLSSMLQQRIDVVALDVTRIDLPWPEE